MSAKLVLLTQDGQARGLALLGISTAVSGCKALGQAQDCYRAAC